MLLCATSRHTILRKLLGCSEHNKTTTRYWAWERSTQETKWTQTNKHKPSWRSPTARENSWPSVRRGDLTSFSPFLCTQDAILHQVRVVKIEVEFWSDPLSHHPLQPETAIDIFIFFLQWEARGLLGRSPVALKWSNQFRGFFFPKSANREIVHVSLQNLKTRRERAGSSL